MNKPTQLLGNKSQLNMDNHNNAEEKKGFM